MAADRPLGVRMRSSTTSTASPEAVFDTIADLRNHIVWSGELAADDTFKLLELRAPDGPAAPGTVFESSGANFNGTFHDRSVVVEVTRPTTLVIETDARLDRRCGRTWEAHFEHRYDLAPHDGGGTRITYTDTVERVNYVPYWLRAWVRPVFGPIVSRADRKQLMNLARLAEGRAEP